MAALSKDVQLNAPSQVIEQVVAGLRWKDQVIPANPANTTTPPRSNQLRDGNLPRGDRTVDRWYDTTAFAAATPFNYGNSARNMLRAPGLGNLDLLIARNFH